jgi:putative transposase
LLLTFPPFVASYKFVTPAKETTNMRESRFTEEQIIGLLKQAEAGRPVAELCRQAGITDTTFYKWRSEFAGLEVSEARRLRQLEEENRRLKGLVADQVLDIQVLKEVRARPSPSGRAPDHRGARLLRTAGLSVGRPQPQDVSASSAGSRSGSAQAPAGAAEERRRFGCPRLYLLLRREGVAVNHKRVERLYREEALSLRLRPKRKRQTAASPIEP